MILGYVHNIDRQMDWFNSSVALGERTRMSREKHSGAQIFDTALLARVRGVFLGCGRLVPSGRCRQVNGKSKASNRI